MSQRAAGRTGLEVSISIPTILLVAVAVAIAWALASIANVLLLIFVAILSAAVLVPVVSVMERRLRWSRRLCAIVLVLAIVIVIGAVVLVLAQAISDAVREFSDDLPQIVDRVRHSDLGDFINGGSGSLDTLREHAGDITKGAGEVSGGIADVGVSAFGAVTLVFSVTFLTVFGLIDAPHARDWIGSLLYRDKRERYLQVADRIIQTTSRYMLGNVAISLICATVYGVTAVILGLPYPLALAVIAGVLDLIPNLGATIAGLIIGLVALSVSLDALIAFAIVIVVYQQIENYVLQPTIIGKAARISGFTVLASVLAFGALFGLIGAIIAVPIAAGVQIVIEELTAARRARIAATDAAQRRHDHPEAGRCLRPRSELAVKALSVDDVVRARGALRTAKPALLVLALAVLMSIVLPSIDSSAPYRDEVRKGEIAAIADGITLVPAPGWNLASGALLGRTRTPVGGTATTQLVDGSVRFDVQAAPFDGTASALLGRINEIKADLDDARGSGSATTQRYAVTTRQGVAGVAEDFVGVDKHGSIVAFVFTSGGRSAGSGGQPAGEGVEIVVSGPKGPTARRRDEIVAMIRSIRAAS